MNIRFHPEVDEEFIEAIAYYEECEAGLGIDFLREVYACIEKAVTYPSMWPKIELEIHRCLVHRFPYGVLYSVEDHEIYILAIMHLHRNPDYWKYR